MMPPTVSATAVPARTGPSTVNTDASTTAWAGRAARVATSAATALAESWKPLVKSKAKAMTTARSRPPTSPPPFQRTWHVLGGPPASVP